MSAQHLSKNVGWTISAAGGFVGAAAAVSVWSFGSTLSADYQNSQGSGGSAFSANGGSPQNQAADQGGARTNDVGGVVGGFSAGSPGDGRTSANERMAGVGKATQGSLAAQAPSAWSLRNLIAANVVPAGTQAYVEAGAHVQAGANITVDAKDASDLSFTVGGGGGGFVGVGAAIGVLSLSNNARASAAGTLEAGGQIRVNGELTETVGQTSFAFGGGFVGLGASVSYVTDRSTNQAFIGDGAVIDQAGSVLVRARSLQNFDLDTDGVTAGLVAVGASFSYLRLGNPGAADLYVGIGANASIGQGTGSVGDITLDGLSTLRSQQNAFGFSAGAFSGTFNFAIAEYTPDVRASIGDGSRIHSGGAVKVYAGTDHDAHTEVFGISIGLAGHGLSLAKSNIGSVVAARAGGQITADSLSIGAGFNVDPATQQAVHQVYGGDIRGSTAIADAPGVAVVSTSASLGFAASNAEVSAAVGDGAILNVAGVVAVRADSINQAKAKGRGLSVTAIGFSLMNAESEAKGKTSAAVGSGVTMNVGNLSVQGTAIDHADTRNDSTDVGFLGNVGFSRAKADANPTVGARIGAGSAIVATGNVTVRAHSSTDADARALREGLSLGADFGMIKGDASVVPTVSALIESSAATPTTISAGNVDVQATHGSPVAVSDGTLAALDANADLLTTVQPHGLITGDRITYDAGGNAPIGGLVDQRTYGVIVLNDTVVKLGAPFRGSDVDDGLDTIRFASLHGLQTGDRLRYGHGFSDGSTDIGGLNSGTLYYVRVIDPLTIKLGSTLAQVQATLKGFAPSAVDAATDAFTLAGHGFADGQAVTYRGPRTATFQGLVVDDAADKIKIGAAPNGNDFATGDRVSYTVTASAGASPVAIGGLGNGGSYYVYRVDAETIKLSAAPIKNDGSDVFVNLTRSTGADNSFHHLVRFGEKAITGLEDAHTYYVRRIDADHFSLAVTAGGAAINVDTAGVAGTQYIGIEGIDLSGGGVQGQHYLAIDLSGALNGSQRLAGAGGLVATPDQYGIDGVSYANGIGPSFALLISGVGSWAEVDIDPTVIAAAGDGARIQASGDVTIKGVAYGNAGAEANATTGAFIGSIGFSDVDMDLHHDTQARVGAGASIEAGGAIEVWAENVHAATGTAYAGGGAAGVSVTGATTEAEATPNTLADIGAGAQLHAKGDIGVSARMSANGQVKADSVAYAGLGSGGASEAFWSLGGLTSDFDSAPLSTTVNLGANSNVRAEGNLDLYALNSDTHVETRSASSAASLFYSDPDAESRSFINTIALVNAEAGAVAIGVDSFDAAARHSGVGAYTRAYAEGGSAFGAPDADAWGIVRTLSRVITAAGSAFGSKNLQVDAAVYSPSNGISQETRGFSLNPFDDRGGAHWDPDGYGFRRHITFNGDVILLSAPTPELVVNAAGAITVHEGVDAVDEGTRIVVNDLSNDGNAGKATFDTHPMTVSNGAIPEFPIFGRIDGDQGTVIVRHTWETVQLTNHSSKDLWINAIDPVDRSGRAKVYLNTDDNDYRFDIAHDYAPTVIDIASLGETGTPNVFINGLIDNPIGTTNIVNTRGSVLGTTPGWAPATAGSARTWSTSTRPAASARCRRSTWARCSSAGSTWSWCKARAARPI